MIRLFHPLKNDRLLTKSYFLVDISRIFPFLSRYVISQNYTRLKKFDNLLRIMPRRSERNIIFVRYSNKSSPNLFQIKLITYFHKFLYKILTMKVELPETHILELLWYWYFYCYAMVSDSVWHLLKPSLSESATEQEKAREKNRQY